MSVTDQPTTTNQPIIQQVNWQPNGIEIIYIEPRDQETAARTGIITTRVKFVPFNLVAELIPDLVDSVSAILDAAGSAERGAPDTFRR